MREYGWDEVPEHLEGRALEAHLTRRDLLRRASYTAGLAAVASSLPASYLLARAAKAQASIPLPANVPIDHFVILMMENRSFDHYLGWLPGADGMQSETYLDSNGASHNTAHSDVIVGTQAQWQGCGFGDPGHGWDEGRVQLGSSAGNPAVAPDGFIKNGSGNDDFALSYYNENELGFIHPAARNFTTYDRYFCSLLGPTWPNRYYKWSAQSGGLKNNTPPVATGGNQWETIFDRVLKNNPGNLPTGLTARYYNSDLPFSAVWGPRGVPWTRPVTEYYADCAAGTLANVTIIDPPFRDGGGGDGMSADEHPLGDVRLGQAFMSDVVHAFMASPNFRRGALFIIYDEWGGFFDHVRPPQVPDDRASTNLNSDFSQMGFRTPAAVVSPLTVNTAGPATPRVSHTQLGHESIIKLITYRFGLGDLCTRDANAANIGDTFDWSIDPTTVDIPDLPDPEHIASRPCSIGGGDVVDPNNAHASDMADLETLAERFGYKVGDAKPSDIFREPDSVKKALAASL